MPLVIENSTCTADTTVYSVMEPDPNPRRQKWPRKYKTFFKNFIFVRAGCSLLRTEGFSFSLDVLHGGL